MSKVTGIPLGDRKISLAMLGMVEGNGHPYSWSAIFNGYNEEEMMKCPYAGIPEYLSKEPNENLSIPGAKVTHIWTDDLADAEKVAKASLIPNVVRAPEDVIGEVDAVIIATDKGYEHIQRCRMFVEAGIPVFIDKPLTDNKKDLDTFSSWVKDGAAIMSSSAFRYCKEYMPYRLSVNELGQLRYVNITMAKSWERYGIHALEGIYPILGPGFLSVRNIGDERRNIVHLKHKKNVDVIISNIDDLYGSFGVLGLFGTKDNVTVRMKDTFYAFKKQLEEFVTYLRTGVLPFPYEETEEMMKIIIAGIESRNSNSIIYI
jgi:hypothetical protein